MQKIKKIIFFFSLFFLTIPLICLSAVADGGGGGTGGGAGDTTPLDTTAITCLGNISSANSIPDIIGCLYNSVVALSGICALLMIIIGGFEWLISAGDVGRIGSAKEKISSAIIGLLIVLASYLILTVIGINP